MDVTRRSFGKTLLASAAVATVAIPSLAGAMVPTKAEKDDGFNAALQTMYPATFSDREIKLGKKVAFFKNQQSKKNNDSVDVNGMGSFVLQLCRGFFSYEDIVNNVVKIYNLSPVQAQQSVSAFLKYAFEAGLVFFVSDSYLSPAEKKKGRGANVPNFSDTAIQVYEKAGTTLTF